MTELELGQFLRMRFHQPRMNWPSSRDRKSTRLNSSHTVSSYAVFCLKKKKVQRPGFLNLNDAELPQEPAIFQHLTSRVTHPDGLRSERHLGVLAPRTTA